MRWEYCQSHKCSTDEELDSFSSSLQCLAVNLNNFQADEEMLLLEALDTSGLGNWSAVAAHIGSKTEEESKAHYFEVFLR